jgi:hypothetical protein
MLTQFKMELLKNKETVAIKVLEENTSSKILFLTNDNFISYQIRQKFKSFVGLNGPYNKVHSKLAKNNNIIMSSRFNCYAGVPLPNFDVVVTTPCIPPDYVKSVIARIPNMGVKLINLVSQSERI